MLFALFWGALRLSAEEDRKVSAEGDFNLPILGEVRALQLENPHAQILVEVDAEGELVDLMPFSATHHALLESAEKTVRAATFGPAVVDGQPTGGRLKINVRFYDPEQEAWRSGAGPIPMGGNVSDAVERRRYKVSADSFVFRESEPSELDEPIEILSSKIRLYTSEEGVRRTGSCKVEYFVGPEGRVHFPRILESDHDDISMSALLTLEETVFKAPRRGGSPTWVRLRQPFNFSE